MLIVEHIYADPNYPIGNQLEIHLRQTSTLEFIEMDRSASQTTLMINEEGVQPGVYQLVIESFDALSVA